MVWDRTDVVLNAWRVRKERKKKKKQRRILWVFVLLFFYKEPPNAGKFMTIIHEGGKKKQKIYIFSRKRNRRTGGWGWRAIVSPPSYASFDRENIIERMRNSWVSYCTSTYVVCIIVVRRAGWGLISGRAAKEGKEKKWLANNMHSPKLNL